MTTAAREDICRILVRYLRQHNLSPTPVSELVAVPPRNDHGGDTGLLVSATAVSHFASLRIPFAIAAPYQTTTRHGHTMGYQLPLHSKSAPYILLLKFPWSYDPGSDVPAATFFCPACRSAKMRSLLARVCRSQCTVSSDLRTTPEENCRSRDVSNYTLRAVVSHTETLQRHERCSCTLRHGICNCIASSVCGCHELAISKPHLSDI